MAKVTVHKDQEAATPSEAIVKAANKVITVTDTLNRVIGVKKMTLLDRMRMFEAIGPENCKNEIYVGHAALIFSVVSIDGDPVARPANKMQLEALIQRLGDEGLEAVGAHFEAEAKAASEAEADKESLKNGWSTPS